MKTPEPRASLSPAGGGEGWYEGESLSRPRALRRSMTDAERLLWRRLRANQLGFKFRRQHEIAGYIVDFVCKARLLIIELDGSQHLDQHAYDERRTHTLESQNFRVLRFWNNQVLFETDAVLAAISLTLAERQPPHPNPLPRRRGRGSRDISARTNTIAMRRQTCTGLSVGFSRERNVLEVETPILSTGANTDPNIQSFSTSFSGRGAGARWLRTSSEFAQKRLLAAGIGDCYELGRVFRNGEAGARHNPEFTMLEWYRVGRDHRWLAGETVDLIEAALGSVGKSADVHRTTYRELFTSTIRIDPFVDEENALRAALGDNAIDPHGLTRDDWLDLLLTHRIQPEFPHDRITVVIDYPPTQCALAQVDNGVAERFEVYAGTHELANGYHELTDAAEQRRRFERDNARRRERGLAELPFDEHLLSALDRGMPACAGVALGVERLLMAMLDTDDIADVLAFPFAEA